MLPSSIMTFWSLTHAPSTPLSVLVARATAWLMASSKPVSDVALNSVTRATLIVSASFQSSFCGLVAHLICGPTERKPNIMAEAPRRMPRPDRLWLRYCVERGPCLLCVGNVNVEVVDCRRGFSDEAGAGRVAHTHDLEAALLVHVASIGHLNNISYGMACHVFNVLHLLDANQLGRREFVYRGLSAWKKTPVANLRRHEEPPCLVDSYGIQSRPQQ